MFKNQKNILVIAVVLTAAAVIILTVAGFAASDTEYEPSGWVLKAYGNSVALYNNGKIQTVYGEIVLDDLPEDDIKMLQSGIAFPTRDEAQRALEDYDG